MSLSRTRFMLTRIINCQLKRNHFDCVPNKLRREYYTLTRIILPSNSSTLQTNNNVTQWYCTKKDLPTQESNELPEKNLSLFKRFKQMYKNYWYVLVPVHLVTSAVWFGSFYYLAKSGVDVVSILESMHVSEKITNNLKDSSMGYIAISYALYKIATPLRYTVTLGGTTVSIKYLRDWGYIKPVPTAQTLKNMYEEKKTDMMDAVRGTKVELEQQKEKLKDKRETIMKDITQKINPIKTIKKKNCRY